MTAPMYRSQPAHPPSMAVAFRDLDAELVGLRERVEAVRTLHRRGEWSHSHHEPYCEECGFNVGWPCPTIKALDGES